MEKGDCVLSGGRQSALDFVRIVLAQRRRRSRVLNCPGIVSFPFFVLRNLFRIDAGLMFPLPDFVKTPLPKATTCRTASEGRSDAGGTGCFCISILYGGERPSRGGREPCNSAERTLFFRDAPLRPNAALGRLLDGKTNSV
ncbi:hypothetical protein M2323_004244 [Rhodoblastus acidophilus]|uniref:hypothetical protein n=1 Tax=Rhodoblastus acidophilus TaxID=1074 RepID=UPI0022241FFC|nr:hypothetical protein [Rhodoblastus acidophilus]MCW2286449.1 hypothetical protein [Rhodoblastus acidophilus]MCW2335298.1 hypothetical protein [Rhodoblastus acidophilus]